jgi:hypothetical protein
MDNLGPVFALKLAIPLTMDDVGVSKGGEFSILSKAKKKKI